MTQTVGILGYQGCIEPHRCDAGLLTGTLSEMQALATRLTRMRTARGMTSTVAVVAVS